MVNTKEIEDHNEEKFTFGEHLEELRSRVIYSLIAVVVCFVLCWCFKSQLLLIVERPHIIAMQKFGLTTALQVISYQEGFYAYMKLCFIAAVFFAYPVVMYQIWRFVVPGLYRKEKRYFLLFIVLSFGAFLVGIVFGYFLLIPIGLQFLIGILGAGVAPIITMGQYISFVLLLTFAIGLVFQLPLIMYLLMSMGIFSVDSFISWRKYAILSAFVIGAVITPPDPFTQTMTAIPMIVLYEIGILIVRPTKRGIMYLGGLVGGGSLSIFLLFTVFTHLSVSGTISVVKGDIIVGTGIGDSSRYGVGVKKAGVDVVKIHKGMSLKTDAGDRAELDINDGIGIIIDAETEIKLTGKRAINLVRGQILVDVSDSKNSFGITTPDGVVETNGGQINVQVFVNETVVTVVGGRAVLIGDGIKRTIVEGRQARINTGGEVVDVNKVIRWMQGL